MRKQSQLAYIGMLSLLAGTSAIGQQSHSHPIFVNGQAQSVPAFQDSTRWIRQELWVETEVDSDHDGKRDRVHVDVVRPQQTATEGLKVPVIYESSPYYSRQYSGRPQRAFWDVHQEVDAAPPPRQLFPPEFSAKSGAIVSMSYVATWVPRGFAVVHSESPGTGLSEGCPTIGGANEALAPKAVIDWLNGRARGFTTVDGNEPVVASWSTGKVGMIGTSYDGTLALAAATTGVDGLMAVVPVSPVSSWYEYYRSNGLVRSPGGYLGEDIDVLFDALNTGRRGSFCAMAIRDSELVKGFDRTTGDSNAFWARRDYLAHAGQIKAAVLFAHGLDDWNTMLDQSARIYTALRKQHKPVFMFLHPGGHGGDPPRAQLNQWFTHYLYGVANGVDTTPRISIVQEGNDNSNPILSTDYPNPAAAPVTFAVHSGGNDIGGLSLTHRSEHVRETFADDVGLSAGALVHATHDNHRLLYATPALAKAIHVSGWSTITLRIASSTPAANLSVYLIALPSTQDSTPDSTRKVRLITRGWADPQNYKSLAHSEPLVPGRFYTMHFTLQPADRLIPAGMRLGLMIFSSDKAFTVWPHPGTTITVDLDATSVTLPIVDGAQALVWANTRHM